MPKNSSGKKRKFNNPIIEKYRGVDIRQYPMIRIRVSVYEMKRIIDAQKDFSMSVREAVTDKKILKEK